MICISNALWVEGNTSRSRFPFKRTISGIINTSDILFSNPIQRTYKRPSIIDVIIPNYSSKKMSILNKHFPACINAFAMIRVAWYRILFSARKHNIMDNTKWVAVQQQNGQERRSLPTLFLRASKLINTAGTETNTSDTLVCVKIFAKKINTPLLLHIINVMSS